MEVYDDELGEWDSDDLYDEESGNLFILDYDDLDYDDVPEDYIDLLDQDKDEYIGD